MKFVLTLYLCSSVFSKCLVIPGYPKQIDTYVDCVKAGLKDAQSHLFAEDGLTEKEIELNKFYVSYTCTQPRTKIT